MKEVQKRLEWNKRLIEKRADKLMTQVERAGLAANALGMVPEVKKESSSDGGGWEDEDSDDDGPIIDMANIKDFSDEESDEELQEALSRCSAGG